MFIRFDMGKLPLIIFLTGCVSSISSQTEDFAFEQELQAASTQTIVPLKRLWGIPDTKAQVGKLMQITVPLDAFDGAITKYEVAYSSS